MNRGFFHSKGGVVMATVPGPRVRSMRRAARARSGLPRTTGKGQITQSHVSGGYRTLHPTNGWRVFTPMRLAAIALTARLKGRII